MARTRLAALVELAAFLSLVETWPLTSVDLLDVAVAVLLVLVDTWASVSVEDRPPLCRRRFLVSLGRSCSVKTSSGAGRFLDPD